MLKIMSNVVALAILVAQANAFAAFQTATQDHSDKQQANPDKPLKLRAEEVIVDAVVIDKKNRWITDLTADDFEVYEDGVKQKITSFRFESAAAESQSSAPKTDSAPAPTRAFNLVTLVFDSQTTRDGALRARKAALDYIEKGMGANDYVAVFGLDLNLLLLAPYTNDKADLKQAVEAFTSRESKKYNAVASEARSRLEGLVEPLSDAKKIALAESITEGDIAFPTPPTKDAKDNTVVIEPTQALKATIYLSGLKVLRTFERYEREFQGHRSVDALLAIINGQKGVRAGRKVLMYFSEGFAVTPAVSEQFRSVISAANTSGVTIYAFDIAGLRLESPNAQSMLERDVAAQSRMRNANPELVQGGVSAIGRSEEVARINNVTTLDELSEDTGGYTIKNTNDVTEGLKRILDELDNHYVMTYSSANQNYNGKFRRINVKLSRAGEYKIRARRGYYALRTLDDSSVLAYEAPLLERVSGETIVNDFPMHAQALQFRGTNEARLLAVYIEFPLSALKFDTDDKSKSFSSRFAILALVRNDSGEVVHKLGQQFTLRGPLAQMAEVKSKPQIYNRMVMLAPGHYTLEAVARDTATGKASVTRMPFDVASASQDALSVSSVVLSRGVNPLTEEQKKQARHPLYLEGQAYFVPNIEQTFRLARDKNILVHFNVYTPKGAASKVNATVAFMKDGSVFTQAGGALPDPDAMGKIAYATSFPTEHFQPGEYDLKITVTDGSRRSTSTAHFKVEP
jgi:VWFA-related protein